MTPITVRILQGAAAGRTRTFDEPQLAFGRSPDCHVVIDVPEASRYHGAMVFEGGHWTVVNNSPNGTSVNGRKLGKKRPELRSGDVIGVGKFGLFEVEIAQPQPPAPVTGPAADPTAAGEVPEPANKISGKSKLWIGIGVYFFLMLVVFIVLTQVAGNGPGNGVAAAQPLTAEQIEKEITQPLDLAPNEREADAALKTAQEAYQQAGVDLSARYRAYRAFKRAEAYSNGKILSDPTNAQAGMNQREFKKCERELIDAVVQQYQEAYNQLRAGQFAEAEKAFRDLQRMYPDATSRIHRNAGQQISVARAKAGAARR